MTLYDLLAVLLPVLAVCGLLLWGLLRLLCAVVPLVLWEMSWTERLELATVLAALAFVALHWRDLVPSVYTLLLVSTLACLLGLLGLLWRFPGSCWLALWFGGVIAPTLFFLALALTLPLLLLHELREEAPPRPRRPRPRPLPPGAAPPAPED